MIRIDPSKIRSSWTIEAGKVEPKPIRAKLIAYRRANNKCIQCGDPTIDGKRLCKLHNQLATEAAKKYREANPDYVKRSLDKQAIKRAADPEAVNARERARRLKKKLGDECLYGGCHELRAKDGSMFCAECAVKVRDSAVKYYYAKGKERRQTVGAAAYAERSKKYYKRKVALKICVSCPNKTKGKSTRCGKCLKKRRNAEAKNGSRTRTTG